MGGKQASHFSTGADGPAAATNSTHGSVRWHGDPAQRAGYRACLHYLLPKAGDRHDQVYLALHRHDDRASLDLDGPADPPVAGALGQVRLSSHERAVPTATQVQLR